MVVFVTPTRDAVVDDALVGQTSGTVTVLASCPGSNPPVRGSRRDHIQTLKTTARETQRGVLSFARDRPGVAVRNQLWLSNTVVLEVDLGRVSLEEIARVPEVERISENARFVPVDDTDPAATTAGGPAIGPTDHGEQTDGLAVLNVPEVWEQYDTTGTGTKVAVLDTGIDPDHPDLDLYTEDSTDPTYPGGWAEWDSQGNEIEDSQPHESDGQASHGTHVSGTVAGGSESPRGHIGVAPDVSLLHGGVLTDEANGSLAAVEAGLQWAVEEGADVINMSLGPDGGGYFPSMIEALQNVQSVGVLVVSASGNDGEGTSGSPANIYGAGMAIGSVDSDGAVPFNSSGELVVTEEDWDGADPEDIEDWPPEYIVPDVTAPGVAVYSAQQDGEYGELSGTSMATPHVAGVAALMLDASDDPLDPTDIWHSLETTAWKPDDWEEGDAADSIDGKDSRYGVGIVDAKAATDMVALESGIEGTVTDTDGTHLADVVVETDDQTTSTDDAGVYSLTAPAGEYTVSTAPFGYGPSSHEVSVAENAFTEQDFELAPELAGRVLDPQPSVLTDGATLEATIEAAHAETATVTHLGDYDESALSLAVGGETTTFDESVDLAAGVNTVTLTVETTVGSTGDVELAVELADSDDTETVTTGTTTVFETEAVVGVVDATGEFGAELVDILETYAPPTFDVAVTDTESVIDNPDDYDAVVAQTLAETAVEQFVSTTESEGIGVVYLDQWSNEEDFAENGANALPQYAGASDAVIETAQADQVTTPISYSVTSEHPILEGFETDETVALHEGEFGDHTWFELSEDTSFDELATLQHGDGVEGAALAVDEDLAVVLASNLGHSEFISTNEFTTDALRILADAVEHAVETAPVDLTDIEFAVATESEAVTIADGETVGYQATALYSDDTEESITADVAVESSDPAVVSVDEEATQITGEDVGEDVTVTASYEEFEDAVTVAVEDRPWGSLDVSDQTPVEGAITVDAVTTGQDSALVLTFGSDGAEIVAGRVAADTVEDVTRDLTIEDNGGFPGDHGVWLFDDGVDASFEPGTDIAAVTEEALDSGAADLAAGVPELSVDPVAVDQNGSVELVVAGAFVDSLAVSKLWVDWTVEILDTDGAGKPENGEIESSVAFDWGEGLQAWATPTLSIGPPETYVGGTYLLDVSASADGQTVSDSTTLSIDPVT